MTFKMKEQPAWSRRELCAGAYQAASGAALAALVSSCGGGGSSPTSPTPGPGGGSSGGVSLLSVITGTVIGGTVQAQAASGPLANVGGAARVESTAGSFLVTRTGQDAFTVVTAICTHETCTITGLSGATYVCSCHGSRFNSGGQVLAGPATGSLRTFVTSFSGGTLSITV